MPNYVVIESMKDVTKTFVGENKMRWHEAKLELFKVNRNIEKKIVEWENELGQHNKNCVMNELQRLWDRKKTLVNIINN
jgi:hypothetical protein